jgi:hypothetical protein
MCLQSQHVYKLVQIIIIPPNCVIPTLCLWSRLCVAERGKLHHAYSMFIFYMLCIRKKETVAYLQYVHVLDFVHQKDRNCMIPTVCSWPRFCVSERVKLYDTYNMFIFCILCIRKRETVSYLQYVYVLDFVYQKASERAKLYHTYSMFMI